MSGWKHERRAVITGMGVIAPNGNDLVTFWESVRDGRSAARTLTRFELGDLPSRVAAEVRDFDLAQYTDPSARNLNQRYPLQIAFAACAVFLLHRRQTHYVPTESVVLAAGGQKVAFLVDRVHQFMLRFVEVPFPAQVRIRLQIKLAEIVFRKILQPVDRILVCQCRDFRYPVAHQKVACFVAQPHSHVRNGQIHRRHFRVFLQIKHALQQHAAKYADDCERSDELKQAEAALLVTVGVFRHGLISSSPPDRDPRSAGKHRGRVSVPLRRGKR